MIRTKQKLALNAERIRVLRDIQLATVDGGFPTETKKASDCTSDREPCTLTTG